MGIAAAAACGMRPAGGDGGCCGVAPDDGGGGGGLTTGTRGAGELGVATVLAGGVGGGGGNVSVCESVGKSSFANRLTRRGGAPAAGGAAGGVGVSDAAEPEPGGDGDALADDELAVALSVGVAVDVPAGVDDAVDDEDPLAPELASLWRTPAAAADRGELAELPALGAGD